MKQKIIQNIGYILSSIIAISLTIFILIQYDHLPNLIPIHFNLVGQITNYGNKQEIFKFLLIACIAPVFFFCIELSPQYLKLPLTTIKKSTIQKWTHLILMWMSLIFEVCMAYLMYLTIKDIDIPINIIYVITTSCIIFLCSIYAILEYHKMDR